MNSLCSCGGRTPCIQNFCDSIPLAPERTNDVLAVADCIEEVRQAEPGEIEALTEQWKALVRCKFRRAVAALSAPGAVLPVAAPPVAAPAVPVILAAPVQSPEPSDDEEEAPPAAEAPPPVPRRGHICEVRRVGDKKWRRFASQVDAAAAFPGISPQQMRKLINDKPGARHRAPKDIRDKYEARDVFEASESDSESDSDSDDERVVIVEMRRVGDTAWRGFASQKAAGKAFGINQSEVSRLVTNRARASPRAREFEARRPGEDASDEEAAPESESESDSENPAPAAAGDDDEAPAVRAPNNPKGKVGCEVRRVGDKKWRRFKSLKDADRVFPGLTCQYIGWLINHKSGPQVAPPHIRDKYEARNAVESSDSDSEAPAANDDVAETPAAAEEDDSDSDTEPSPTPERRARQRPSAKRPRADAKPAVPALVVHFKGGGVANHGTLAGLIAAGLIFPGPIIVEWHRSLPDHHRAEGTLLEDGRLQYKGKTYDTPAAFTRATGVTGKHNAYHVLYTPDGTPIQSFRGGAGQAPVPLG